MVVYTGDGQWRINQFTDAAPIGLPMHTCMFCGVRIEDDMISTHESFHDRNP